MPGPGVPSSGTRVPHLGLGYPPLRTGVLPHLRLEYPPAWDRALPPRTGVLPVWDWGTPTWEWGTPQPGTVSTPQEGTWTSHWGTPRKDMEPVEVLWDGDGYPTRKDMEMGYLKGHGTSGILWDWDGVHPPPAKFNRHAAVKA